ncbi:MAG: single-stranded DNA-binding protein [Candidatus Theseobacter exili]|nr:single-stranded DNA-binding protein [Candidatus Theseobacter exili]
MADLNRVFLAGRLTRDPELRYTSGGQAVADLGLAIGRNYVTKSGERREEVTYVDIVVWGRQAETSGEYLSKGSPILIEGRLHLDIWETKEGEKRSRMRVHAMRVQFLGRPRSASTESASTESVQSESKSSDVAEKTNEDIINSANEVGEDDIPF